MFVKFGQGLWGAQTLYTIVCVSWSFDKDCPEPKRFYCRIVLFQTGNFKFTHKKFSFFVENFPHHSGSFYFSMGGGEGLKNLGDGSNLRL